MQGRFENFIGFHQYSREQDSTNSNAAQERALPPEIRHHAQSPSDDFIYHSRAFFLDL